MVLRATWRALGPQRLPPLPTTALHGALGHVFKRLSCIEPARTVCDGCPQATTCAYPLHFEPAAQDGAGGVTNRAPSPWIISPELPLASSPSLELADGEALAVRLTLLGSAITQRALFQAAFVEAGREGLGIEGAGIEGKPGGRRPELRLERFEVVAPPARPVPASVRLTFVTPVRLTSEGKVSRDIDADLLWSSLNRRATLLSRYWGTSTAAAPLTSAPFEVKAVALRQVAVRRYSSRQQSHMTWPGLMGEVSLAGAGLGEAWPLLCWGEQVQVGKGVTFGFGRYRLD
jgi:hypothetical protein